MRLKTQKSNRDLRDRAERGFTFMELMIVMAIIGILATVAIPSVIKHLQRAKEVVLMQDMFAMRRAIDSFWQDKDRPPANLQELVSAGYLRDIPKDPICSECQWNEIAAPADDANAAGGIGDVKSSAPGEDSNGKSYSEY
jgi:general secretion pathway protein G